jgi:hypothetical protein
MACRCLVTELSHLSLFYPVRMFSRHLSLVTGYSLLFTDIPSFQCSNIPGLLTCHLSLN